MTPAPPTPPAPAPPRRRRSPRGTPLWPGSPTGAHATWEGRLPGPRRRSEEAAPSSRRPPALAGGLVQAVTAPLALVVDAASFVASAGLLGTIRAREPAPAAPPARQPLWRALGAGLRVIVAHPVLRTLTGAWGLYFFFDSLFQGQFPLYVTRDLALTPATLGLIISLSSIGGVAGALLAGRVAARFGLGPTLAGAVLIGALGELLVAAAGGPDVAVVATLVLAHVLVRATDMVFSINYTSVWQALTPDRLRGRVGGTVRVLTAGSVPLGAVIGGAIGEAVGLRATAVIAGLGVVGAFLWLVLSPVRALRELPEQPEEPGDGTAAEAPAPEAPPGSQMDAPDARQPAARGF